MRTIVAGAIVAAAFVISCGKAEDPEVRHEPAPTAVAYPAAAVTRACVKCHDGAKHPLDFSKPEVFKASNAKARLTAGTMPPPPGQVTDADKAAMLAYLGG